MLSIEDNRLGPLAQMTMSHFPFETAAIFSVNKENLNAFFVHLFAK